MEPPAQDPGSRTSERCAVTYQIDPRVDAYIDTLPAWQRDICKTARTVSLREQQSINVPALTEMFRQIIAINRAGGWRKLKSAR